MTVFVAFLRAINVGGTGKLPMGELRALCADIGFENVQTFIQSGNVVFTTAHSDEDVRLMLESRLEQHAGSQVDVVVRTAAELARVVDANPFPDAEGAKVAVVLGNAQVPDSVVGDTVAPDGEEVVAGVREVYIHYPDGMGRSKLKLPKAVGIVTVRNINTVTKLVELAKGLPGD